MTCRNRYRDIFAAFNPGVIVYTKTPAVIVYTKPPGVIEQPPPRRTRDGGCKIRWLATSEDIAVAVEGLFRIVENGDDEALVSDVCRLGGVCRRKNNDRVYL